MLHHREAEEKEQEEKPVAGVGQPHHQSLHRGTGQPRPLPGSDEGVVEGSP